MVTFYHKDHRRILLKLIMTTSNRWHVHLRSFAYTNHSEAFHQALDEPITPAMRDPVRPASLNEKETLRGVSVRINMGGNAFKVL